MFFAPQIESVCVINTMENKLKIYYLFAGDLTCSILLSKASGLSRIDRSTEPGLEAVE